MLFEAQGIALLEKAIISQPLFIHSLIHSCIHLLSVLFHLQSAEVHRSVYKPYNNFKE